jgi:hypothetical protein
VALCHLAHLRLALPVAGALACAPAGTSRSELAAPQLGDSSSQVSGTIFAEVVVDEANWLTTLVS